MHEMSLIYDLMKKIEEVRVKNGAQRIKKVRVKIGALAHISGDHFREHFYEAAQNTGAQNAELVIEESKDIKDPRAQEILLQNIDVEVVEEN